MFSSVGNVIFACKNSKTLLKKWTNKKNSLLLEIRPCLRSKNNKGGCMPAEAAGSVALILHYHW